MGSDHTGGRLARDFAREYRSQGISQGDRRQGPARGDPRRADAGMGRAQGV